MKNIRILTLLLISLISCNTQTKPIDKIMTEGLIITGKNDVTDIQNKEIVVLTKFYKAFNNRDLELMKNVWLNTKEASMNNPLGGIMRDWAEIESVYNKIFNGKAKVYVEFYDFTIHKTENMFFVTGKEKGYFRTDEKEIQLAIRTSRVFIKINGKWKQIQHHGSIDNPELLKKYQKLVSN